MNEHCEADKIQTQETAWDWEHILFFMAVYSLCILNPYLSVPSLYWIHVHFKMFIGFILKKTVTKYLKSSVAFAFRLQWWRQRMERQCVVWLQWPGTSARLVTSHVVSVLTELFSFVFILIISLYNNNNNNNNVHLSCAHQRPEHSHNTY